MKYKIKNDVLEVCIDSFGAEICSVKDANGVEYLWNGDAKY